MKLDNKGFTLVELLVVVAIMALLIGIAVPSILAISNRIKTNMYCAKIEVLENDAKLWGKDNEGQLQVITGTQTYNNVNAAGSLITVQTLIDGGYVNTDQLEEGYVNDPRDTSEAGRMNDVQIKVYIKNTRVYAKIPSAIATCEK